jgi:general secretion pathway protein C
MDWLRHFRFSLSDVQGLVSRRTVILVLMAVFLYQGVGIFYKVLTLQIIRMRPAPATEIKAQAAAPTARDPLDGYKAIPERNLFGTTAKTVADKQAGPAQQDVALLVDLRGTVAGDGKTGFAIVEEKGTRKQRLVKVGDVIAGAKLVRIKRNAVDVEVDGQERTIKMVETKEAPILPSSGSAATAPGAGAPVISRGEIVVNRAEIGAGLQDMGSMLRQAQVRPYFNAGVPDGFMISNIQAGSIYQKMGMVDGDIIQGVDSRKIQTADDMMSLFNTLKGASSMALSIRRGGRQETLNYQFR